MGLMSTLLERAAKREPIRKAVQPTSFLGVYSVLDFGAKNDAVPLLDASVVAGSARVVSQSASFSAADVGKLVRIQGAGPDYVPAPTDAGCTAATNPTGNSAVFVMPNHVTVGQYVTTSGFTPAGYNGTFPVTAVTPFCARSTKNSAFTATLGTSGLGPATTLGTITYGLPLATTIASVVDSRTVILSTSTSRSVSNGKMVYGSDNAAAISTTLLSAGPTYPTFYPPGGYMVGSMVALPDYARMWGAGIHQSVLIAHSGSFSPFAPSAIGMHLKDLRFRGPGFREYTNLHSLLNGGNVNDGLIEYCVFEEGCGQGINFADTSYDVIVHHTGFFNNGDEGTYLGSHTDRFDIHHCRYTSNWKSAIDVGGKDHLLVFNQFYFPGVANDGIDPEAILVNGRYPRECTGVTIEGNLVDGGYMGFRLTVEGTSGGQCHDNSVCNNMIRNTTWQALDLNVGTGATTVTDNHAFDIQNYAITVNGSSDNLLEHNHLVRCGNSSSGAIILYNGATNNTVQDNRGNYSPGYAIRINSPIDRNNILRNNDLRFNTGPAIQDGAGPGSGNYIAGNAGWNPQGGLISQPQVPPSGTQVVNTTGYDAMVTMYAAGINQVTVDGQRMIQSGAVTSYSVFVANGKPVMPVYSGTMSWKWQGL